MRGRIEDPAVRWKKVTLVGVGLLGGSLGQALRKRKLAGTVVGYVRRTASIRESETAGAVDLATRDLHSAVNGADLIIICTPIGQMEALVRQFAGDLSVGAIVTDVGSVKGGVVAGLERLVRSAGAHFVGSHPMAGAEKTGVQAARPDLFQNAVCVVTPSAKAPGKAVRKVEALWKSVGARILRLSPAAHDELVSRSSHLPHVVASGLARYVLSPKRSREQSMLCANGFRDTTRIASGSPEMWRDIAVANRKNLLRSLEGLLAELGAFQRLLRADDAEAIGRFFAQAKARRDRWAHCPVSPSPE
jgi:prephenate dehydrogenase